MKVICMGLIESIRDMIMIESVLTQQLWRK
jgi:hypothetical protein